MAFAKAKASFLFEIFGGIENTARCGFYFPETPGEDCFFEKICISKFFAAVRMMQYGFGEASVPGCLCGTNAYPRVLFREQPEHAARLRTYRSNAAFAEQMHIPKRFSEKVRAISYEGVKRGADLQKNRSAAIRKPF